jgi:alpha-L-fucosidase 2
MIISTMRACIESADLLDTDEQKVKEWQYIIDHLWAIPFREEPGIGEIMQLAYNPDGTIYPSPEEYGRWTNHFSANTSLVFPANVIGIDQKGNREFNAAANVVKNHVAAMNAISPDPIVAARLGLGDVVLERMTNGIRRLQHFPQGLFYNIDHWYNLSLYMDSVKQPDITTQRDYIYDARAKYPKGHPAKPFIQSGLETLSIYGAATNEMLLHSNEGKIRVFPAIPKGWTPAFRLRARGAFIVSSKMNTDGSIPGIHIESLNGNKCKVVNPWAQAVIVVKADDNNATVNYKILEKNGIEFQTEKGQAYLIIPKGKGPLTTEIFKSVANDAPKQFLEAELGKHKNF